jgi:type IV pilus assembly protein PilC
MSAATIGRFAYQARDGKGQAVQGFVNALNLSDATKMLRAEGKYILEIHAAKAGTEATVGETRSSNGRVTREEMIQFTLQLSVMVDTGVPLSDALTALAEQIGTSAFTGVLKAISSEVQGGKDFSSTLERYPKIFPKYYCSLIKASEISGTMGPMLKRLADYLVSQREITKRVKGALIYPSFMLVMCVGVTIFLLTVILPKFTAIFAQRKAALPMPTQIMIGCSDALINYWYWWLIGGATVTGGLIWFHAKPAGKRAFDLLKLKLPILGPMFHKLYLSRSLQTLATMIQSGVQVLDALQIVRDVAGNVYYAELWEDVHHRLQGGQPFSEPLLRSTLVPRSVAQMIHSGERSGELPAVMNRISAFMEEDLRTAIKTSTQFIEPVMIGVMGLLIGSVAIAMLLPILTISRVMAQ